MTLDAFDTVKIATSYIIDGKEIGCVPFDTHTPITPVYREFRGWGKNLSAIRKEEELPYQLMAYIRFIEEATGVPVKIISLGPDREQTIIRD